MDHPAGKNFVDFDEDLQVKDLENAAQEGFDSSELMKRYSTVKDDQTAIRLDVRQGESPIGSENLHLGWLDVDVPAAAAGKASIDVRFTYDANGLLEVEARDDEQAAQRYGEIWAAVMARAEALGLGVAHHHGIGAVRRPALASTPPVAAALAARVRDAFDPRRVLARENLRPSGAVFPAVPNVAAIPTPEGGSRG